MAGDLKLKYNSTNALTVTGLQSLASSSAFTSGWSGPTIDNTSDLAYDRMIGANLFAGTSPTDAREIRVYAYAALSVVGGTTIWPDLFSSGTEGTEGAATLHDAENLESGLVFLWSTRTDSTSDAPYPMPPVSLRAAFGGTLPPKCALYVAHNTGVALKSSGQAVYDTPVLEQYT